MINGVIKQEDHGVLLCIAYDTIRHCSSLIVIDARYMQQVAEIFLPFHLPMGLHGHFEKP
ncbi:MAG: carotenoid oxygenase family protein [Gammaproteobacteria bacterium]|nr:carotenoid oxygenase family protein [Gammaproteobacteria bacterium]